MKGKLQKLKPIAVKIFGYTALGSIILLGDQIRRIYEKINKATASDVLSIDRLQPVYIYIEDPFLQEEIAAGVSLNKKRLKLTRFHKWLYDRVEGSFIFRNWFSFRKNLAWRYLRLAQDERRNYRLRAVRSLASLTNLKDADYQQLAQAIDMRTAIGIARSTDNVKFLLDPPYFKRKADRNSIINYLHEFLIIIDSKSKHPCLQNFVSKVFVDITDPDSEGFEEEARFKFDNNEFIPMCLEAIFHHSWTDANAKQIIEEGGLTLFTEIYKYLQEYEAKNIDSLIVLSKIMANISCSIDDPTDFFTSGWIKILSIMSQHKDIRVAVPAQKALCNFDIDDSIQGDVKFSRRMYPLHPARRQLSQPKLDVIFIHGLLGGIFITWRQRDMSHCGHKSPLELLGFTAAIDEGERLASYQTMKPLDQEFFVDVSDVPNWEHLADSYEFVLSDIPVDSNRSSTGPLYGLLKHHVCETCHCLSQLHLNADWQYYQGCEPWRNPKECDCNSRSFTKCWPKDWLAAECPEIRLIGIDYETNISKWTPICPISPFSGGLKDRCSHLLLTLSLAGVGQRPIVWIGHSMGGLVVKGVLSLARASSDPKFRSLFNQTKGIVFYSTPHKGSRLAALNSTSEMILWPSVEVQELRENAPELLALHQDFLKSVKENPFKVITFAERESTYITALKFEIRFVDDNSSDPDVGENYGIPLDHLCICKPAGRQSFLYQKVKRLIKEIITKAVESKKKL